MDWSKVIELGLGIILTVITYYTRKSANESGKARVEAENTFRKKIIYQGAELAFRAVEAIKGKDKLSGEDALLGFFNFLNGWLIASEYAPLSDGEKKELKPWTEIRSKAEKYDRRIANGVNPR